MKPAPIFVKNTNSLRCENPIGEPFYELSEVDSTNNYAMQRVQAHLAGHGTTWFAHYQKAGKGQRGKQWNAERGKNIMMSIVLKTETLRVENQVFLNTAVALGCLDFFSGHAGDKTKIKWPNDIYWGDRKAGGILIESILHGEKWKYSIVGIGININQILFPDHLQHAVSLMQITGQTFDVIQLAKELCKHLEKRWQQLLKHEHEMLLKEYNEGLFKLHKAGIFKKEEEVFPGIVKGVNPRGELIITRENGSTTAYQSIEWL
jgi:BirA family biotin operon repressor/biotin-[acetyl-CoA-carboxylase] ligase